MHARWSFLPVALLTAGCFQALGSLGTECSSSSDCTDGLTCLPLGGSSICTTDCNSGTCTDGVCVTTEHGLQCAFPCTATAFCEADHECSESVDGQQVCWGADLNLTPLGDFAFDAAMSLNQPSLATCGDPTVSELSLSSGQNSALICIYASNTSRTTASMLWVTSLKVNSPGLEIDIANSEPAIYWTFPNENSVGYCEYRTATGDYDCEASARSAATEGARYGRPATLAPGTEPTPLFFFHLRVKPGTQAQDVPITFQVRSDSGQTADTQVTVSVVP
jgi:hypothetical protein